MTGGYGVRSEADLIDMDTIYAGISEFLDALADLNSCGADIIAAGEACNKDALSIDDASLENKIVEFGMELQQIAEAYSKYAEELYGCAITVQQNQVNELNAYKQWLAQQQAQQSA